MSKYIKCPRCRCTDLSIIKDNSFSTSRGLLGYAVTGSIFGASMFSRTKKSVFQCNRCGRTFKSVF